MKHCIYFILLICYVNNGLSQAKVRKLPSSINHPSINLYAPFISADGNAIVFLSDNAEDNALAPFYSFKDPDWREPQMLPKNIYTRLNYIRGYSLSADGRRMYITTMKAPNVGGFDICYSDLKGAAWTDPVNLALPVNSKSHEACPSLSTDGKTVYFMRCEKMDFNSAAGCKLFKSVMKANGQWEEPVELPAFINTGNSQTPRIMADNETLIFSSDKMAGGKGGMDLYQSKYNNGQWSTPVALEFVNTDKDDQYVSAAAVGRYLIKDAQGTRKSELTEFLIPNELRPKGMMKVAGKTDASIPSYISVLNLNTGKMVYNSRPESDGSFSLFLMEGSKYELAIEPETGNFTFFTKMFDLTSDKIPQIEKVNAQIKAVAIGDEVMLEGISFLPNASRLDLKSSTVELKRLARMIKDNPTFKFDIQVSFNGYKEDSVQSSDELTETLENTIHTTYKEIDSLGQLYNIDTMMVKKIYHNDRTVKQAEEIITYLKSQGVQESSMSYSCNAIPATSEERKTIIKAVVKKR